MVKCLPVEVDLPQAIVHIFNSFSRNGGPSNFSANKNKFQKNITSANDLHVLLADDDEDDRLFFTDAISTVAPSLKLTTAQDGEDLFNILITIRNALPDFIFLDLNMPYKNGLECLKEIKSSDLLKSIPVIIYSTSASADQVDSSYNHGANLFIQKPENHRGIVQVLRTIFSADPRRWFGQPDREKFILNSSISGTE